ncbi:FUSC family protein [Povalibacter sp.]|uniref:FUSC family protein n=1 Tax=Povalibacter sp. TaxID=1962978 RepID=UPI002F425F5F
MRILHQRAAFIVANTAAILSALYIGLAADLERPYWAVFSTFIVAAPIAGAVRSKAVWRLAGTVIGAAAALLIVPPLVHSPPLLCLAMAGWVALCLGLSLLDRTPRSYVLMLSGYTATIVGLAVVDVPLAIFDTAVARVEEISVGIICGALAHSIFFPRTVAVELNEKTATAIRMCAGWISQTLREPTAELQTMAASRRLTQLLADLSTLHTHIAFDLSDVPRIGKHLLVLRERLMALLPAMTNAQLAIDRLRASGGPNAPLNALLADTVRWTDQIAAAADVLDGGGSAPSRAAPLDAAAGESVRWPLLLEQTATHQVQELIAVLEDCRTLARAIRDGGGPLPPHLETQVSSARRLPLYRDYTLALLSAGAAAVAVVVACILWIWGSWPEGAIAAQFAAIGCSFFATLDRPSKMLTATLYAVLLALPVAAFYQFAVLPRIEGFVALALVLVPILLLFSFLQAIPKLTGAALILAISFFGGLAFQKMYQADFAAFLNINLAEIAGVLIAIAINLVFRTIDPTWNALRLSRAAWRTMDRLTQSGSPTAGTHSQLVDCLSQVAMREELVDAARRDQVRSDTLRGLRVGANLVTLNSVERDCGPTFAAPLEAVRRSIGSIFSAWARQRSTPTEDLIGSSLDTSIRTVTALPPSAARMKALAGLVALRIDLAPHSAFQDLQETTA